MMTIAELCAAYDAAQKATASGDHDKVVEACRTMREVRSEIEKAVERGLARIKLGFGGGEVVDLAYFNAWFALRGGWR